MMPAAARVDRTVARTGNRVAMIATTLQLYLLTTYVLVGVVPYLWRQTPAIDEPSNPIMWLLLAPLALLLAVVGFWVVVFDSAVGVIATAAGVAVWAAGRRRFSPRVRAWLLAATLLSAVFALYSYTPLANDIRIFVLD